MHSYRQVHINPNPQVKKAGAKIGVYCQAPDPAYSLVN
jgi:hypothetical protein